MTKKRLETPKSILIIMWKFRCRYSLSPKNEIINRMQAGAVFVNHVRATLLHQGPSRQRQGRGRSTVRCLYHELTCKEKIISEKYGWYFKKEN